MSPDDEREFWGDDDERRPRDWRAFCYIVAAAALIWSAALVAGPLTRADAAAPAELNAPAFLQERWQQPYGGCKEAWMAPRSAGADECRAHGWTIRPRLVVGPHGVVRMSALPHCRYEDGSGQRSACSWNFRDGRRDGNGRGVSLWFDRKDRARYVWPLNATSWWVDWTWVRSGLADALAEGDAPHATTRNWARCMVTRTSTGSRWVTCPNGYQEEVR